jgi:hypothetical protein
MVHSLLCPFLVIYLCSQLGHKAGKFCFLCNSPQRWGLCVSSGRFPLVCSRNFLERVLAIFSVPHASCIFFHLFLCVWLSFGFWGSRLLSCDFRTSGGWIFCAFIYRDFCVCSAYLFKSFFETAGPSGDIFFRLVFFGTQTRPFYLKYADKFI